jgi:predicted phosphoadenosine phosphosulfate sulfurtransferase
MNQNRLMYLFLKTLEHTPQDLKNYILNMKPNKHYDLIYDSYEVEDLRSFKFSLVVHRRKDKDKLRVKNPLSLLQAKNALELYETIECNLWSHLINGEGTNTQNNIFYETLYGMYIYEDEINDYTE